MALTNREKQARFREGNVVVLTCTAAEIAEKLMDMEDQGKLKAIHRLVRNHLRDPNRSAAERNYDLGYWSAAGPNGKRLNATDALALVAQADADAREAERQFMAGEIGEAELARRSPGCADCTGSVVT